MNGLDDRACDVPVDEHEHELFDLISLQRLDLERIREFMGEAVADMSDERLLVNLGRGGRTTFTLMKWKKIRHGVAD